MLNFLLNGIIQILLKNPSSSIFICGRLFVPNINFKNGLFDTVNQKLIPHNPNIFTTCQINANYYEKGSNIFNIDMENFLDDVTSNNPIHKKTLLQFIGYSLTYRTDLGKALFILGPTANNRKKYNY